MGAAAFLIMQFLGVMVVPIVLPAMGCSPGSSAPAFLAPFFFSTSDER